MKEMRETALGNSSSIFLSFYVVFYVNIINDKTNYVWITVENVFFCSVFIYIINVDEYLMNYFYDNIMIEVIGIHFNKYQFQSYF